jgi:hypothetical protein
MLLASDSVVIKTKALLLGFLEIFSSEYSLPTSSLISTKILSKNRTSKTA